MDLRPSKPSWILIVALLCAPAAARGQRSADPDAQKPPSVASILAQERKLNAAKATLDRLSKDRKRRRFRDAWVSVIRDLEAAVRTSPQGPHAAEARLQAARAREHLYIASRVRADAGAAIESYRKVDGASPGTATAQRALVAAAQLAERIGAKRDLGSVCRRLTARYGGTGEAHAACARAAPAPAPAPAMDVARKAADAPSKPVDPDEEDASAELAAPARPPAAPAAPVRSAATAAPAAPIAGARAAAVVQAPSARAQARAARAAPSTADREPDTDTPADAKRSMEELVQRVTAQGAAPVSDAALPRSAAATGAPAPSGSAVASEAPAASPSATALAAGAEAAEPDEEAEPPPEAEEAEALHEPDAADAPPPRAASRVAEAELEEPAPEVAETARALRKTALAEGTPLAAQLGLKVHSVVIDPGHGGKDTGAIGKRGVREKDVSLAIAQRLRGRLQAMGLQVVLTRSDDRYVPLDERARIANEAKADLFISIHCNAARKRKLSGIETWTLNVASNRYAARLAAFENAESPLRVSDLRLILADLAKKANAGDARELAQSVQSSLVRTVRTRVGPVRDHGVKQALFYVLLGAKMPSILVETAFLSNAEEEARLKSGKYQEATAEAIARGVKDFLDSRQRLARAP